MKFLPTKKQKEAHKALKQNRVVLYGGAIRGAKSYWGCMEIISFCFEYPNSRWLMLRETLPVIKNTLLKTFTENFLNNGWSQYVKDFNQQTLILTWVNGSQIIFMAEGYDTDKELNRFRGLEINGAFIDEVNEIQEVTFDKVIERSGSWFHSPGCPTKILMSCNPSANWVKTRFYDRYVNNTLPEGFAYIQAKITDNPHIPKDYLESLKMLPMYQYEVFVNGNWDIQLKTGGEFYKCFELDKHIKPCTYNPSLPIHISWDDNVNPYLPMLICQIVDKKLYIIDEITGITPNNTVKQVCNEFKRRYPLHAAGMFVYGDATANKEDTKMEKGYNFYRMILDELKEYRPNSRVLRSNPSVAMRGNFINTILEKNFNGIEINVSPDCKKTIEDLTNVKEAADGTKNKDSITDPATRVRYQKYGHLSDCLDYVMVSAFADDYQQYQRGGILTMPTLGKNVSKNIY